MQVGVVYTSISAYPLLSAYFFTIHAYNRMRLIIRVYGMQLELSRVHILLIALLPLTHAHGVKKTLYVVLSYSEL